MLIKMLKLGQKPKKANLSKEIANFVNDDFASYKFEPSFKLGDFDRIKEAVNKGIDEREMMKLLEGASEEEQDARTAMVVQHYEQLKNAIPVNLSVDLFGVDEKDPSDFEKSKFIRKVRVLQDPNHILELMKSGQLTGSEVDALNEFYPEYAQALREVITEYIASLHGKPDASLSRKKNAILATVLGVPRISPEALARYQSNLVPGEQPRPEDLTVDAEGIQTDVQQTLNR